MICITCRQDKPLLKDTTKGKYCRDCKCAYLRHWHAARRLAVLRKLSNCYVPFCECCGENIPEFLQIDHINGGGNADRKRGLSSTALINWLIRHGVDRNKFQVLCGSCNGAKGFYGNCPHNKLRKWYILREAEWAAL